MPLVPGTKLGQYEIIESVGAGGMGEVYRARDTKLGRDVAIKVIPERFSQDKERLERFEREARLLAQLNHANIATLHGLEEHDGQQFLVMELVEGETLAERIAQGPISFHHARELLGQITEGLDAAHEKGIIHRDLKPANIKIADDGKVKILDFGLAKVLSSDNQPSELSQSPTITRETIAGVVLGTPSYMSPEQARGRPVDKRTDIWAFGCVLFEMIAGERAFRGEDAAGTLARIIEGEPNWSALPKHTPSSERRLLEHCLQKDPRKRLRDIGDVLALAESPRAEAPQRLDRIRGRLVAAGLGFVAGAIVLFSIQGESGRRPAHVARFNVQYVPLSGMRPAFAMAPDASSLVYRDEREGTGQLYVRRFDSLEVQPIRGTQGGQMPFFAPDARTVGFLAADGMLMQVPMDRGSPTTLVGGRPRGASWGTQGMITYVPSDTGGLSRRNPDGTVAEVTRLDDAKGELTHRWPHVLPGGRGALFALTYTTTDSWDDADIAVAPPDRVDAHRVLIEGGTSPKYVASGHILYARAGALLAAPFDIDRLEMTGPSVTVVDEIMTNPLNGTAYFDVADNGTLAVVRGGSQPTVRQLVWVDRSGRATPLPLDPFPVMRVDISPDGTALVLDIESARVDVWTYELDRGTMTRLTFEGQNLALGFDASGGSVLYWSQGVSKILETSADGTGDSDEVVETSGRGASQTHDGRTLAFVTSDPSTGGDITLLSEETGAVESFVATSFDEGNPSFSPDDRWLAYTSDETGRQEVYVGALAGARRRWQVSTEGGREPVWAPDGRELFYRNLSGDRMMVVQSTVDADFHPGRPRLLFEGKYSTYGGSGRANYDMHPDGDRFIMSIDIAPAPAPIEIVLNWFEELERLAPIKN